MTAAESAGSVERLVGHTRDEATAWPVPDALDDTAAVAIAGGLGDTAARAYAAAGPASPADRARLLADLATEHYFRRDISRLGTGGYVYRFDRRPAHSRLAACHCIELPFVFGTLPAWREAPMLAGDAPAGLVAAVQSAWSSFAHTGDPGNPLVPHWPVHRAPGDLMRLDDPLRGPRLQRAYRPAGHAGTGR